MPKCDFNKVALQLYWNHTSAWLFSCKFAVFFRTPFLKTPLDDCFCAFNFSLTNGEDSVTFIRLDIRAKARLDTTFGFSDE